MKSRTCEVFFDTVTLTRPNTHEAFLAACDMIQHIGLFYGECEHVYEGDTVTTTYETPGALSESACEMQQCRLWMAIYDNKQPGWIINK